MWLKSKTFGLVAASLTVAALLGGSLGIAVAKQRSALGTGQNLVGGPMFGDVEADDYVKCLPSGSWKAVYIWDNRTAEEGGQRWKHFFAEVPAYVNKGEAGGITAIPRYAGVVLVMNSAVANPYLIDSPSENCP